MNPARPVPSTLVHLVRSFPEDSGAKRPSLCGRAICIAGYDREIDGYIARDGRPLASGVSVKVIEEVTCPDCLDVRATVLGGAS